MKKKLRISKRVISMILSFVLALSLVPMSIFGAEGSEDSSYERIVDANTMNGWTKYFDTHEDTLDTSNAGGVWTDKSVFTDAEEFPDSVRMINDEQNFLTALSAIAANKEVVGYSTVPTDTVLVLDLSKSMANSGSEEVLVKAANDAIAKLLAINNNNRVGVVLYSASGEPGTSTYSESVTRILPIDRYTAPDNEYLRLSNNVVSVDRDVVGTNANADLTKSKSFNGGTYIQAGLWEAMKMFEEMDTVISENNWQNGDQRMPIMVLMSDGAPSTGTSYYADVENSQYTTGGRWGTTVYESNVGNGKGLNLTAGNAFLTQLTASYAMTRIENHYKAEDGTVKGLFYTLGFNIDNNSIAKSVMDPDNSTATDSLWDTYNSLTTGSMNVRVENRNGGSSEVAIFKNSYVTGKSYVDEYFDAKAGELGVAFQEIVEEIILQSRYYPTHLEGGSPDFSGYVSFTDTLGEYMEVKQINGILLGNTLFDGHMMASKLADTSENGLGTPEAPTALGDEFIRSVKTRLGISETVDAQALVAKAYNAGQLKYNSATDWSNYIGWYAKADGTYLGFWDENSAASAPEGAVYKIKSYGFLGETTGSIKNSDMMYMTVQVRTDIATGEQTVLWNIPASLVPMVTYLVTLKGMNVDEATDVEVSVEDKNVSPIRLIYETGLRSDLNEFNITRITDAEHIDADGYTRIFWNNYFDISAESHDNHITAMAEFTPNKENERFYFTFDSAVYKKNGTDPYVLVGKNETLDENGEYYHRRYIFENNEDKKPVFFYEKMSSASIKAAVWDDNFELLDHSTEGAWVVHKGTPARELQMYDEEKDVNATDSAHMVFHPYISEQNNTVYVDMNLGNNGLLKVTPATGIKISKTVDIFETGTSDTFKFRVTMSESGSFDSWITALGEIPGGEATVITFVNGVYEFEMKKDQTFWLSGVAAGTSYTVEEISDNDDYKIKSVHVNGVSTGKTAVGTVAQYLIDDVAFINTAVGEGDLVITKQVVDGNGNPVDVNSNVAFTAEVALTDSDGQPVSGSFEASSGSTVTVPATGKFTVTLSEGESFVVRGIPEETRYTVTETNVPAGFEFNEEKSSMSGIVDSSANDQALIVNTYAPVGTGGDDIKVRVTKTISGKRTDWQQGESYTFDLERIDLIRAAGTVIGTATIDFNDTVKERLFTLSNEDYNAAGTYYYRITEQTGTQGGITYDTAERRFSVVVADSDMDGDLEITAVNNEMNTIVSGNWTVTAAFNNVYAPTGSATATINIQKSIKDDRCSLAGFRFALYDADPSENAEANEIVRSGLTDAAGIAVITLNYSAADAGNEYVYYLAEVNGGSTINNIKYSTQVYKVTVTVEDNLDGTISASTVISDLPQDVTVPTFTNEYVPSKSDFISVSGRKEIDGDRVLNANEFQFKIEALTDGAPMPLGEVTTVKNAADGSFSFPVIEFEDRHKGKTYQYKVSEVVSDQIGGFTYDSTVYTVVVEVVDNGNQTITATAEIKKGTETVDNIIFKNTYDAKDAEVTLEGTKHLIGKIMEADEFEFELKAVTDGAPMPEGYVVKNDANGKFVFGTESDPIVYEKAGEYVYTLTEKDKDDSPYGSYDCDDSVYTVTVTVRDNSEGLLTATVSLIKDGMPSTEIVFKNGFVPTPITYDIYADFGGEKLLEGRDLTEGEFEFKLINAANGAQIGDTVKNGQDGEVKFPAVTLPEIGIYHYKIAEVIGDEKGISYDLSSYHIRLEVVQEDSGALTIADKKLYKGIVEKIDVNGVPTETTVYEDITQNGNGKIVFNNSYKADPVRVTLGGTKTLLGRDLKEGEFKFLLKDSSGRTIDEATNAADGSFVFDSIPPYIDKGEYRYTVVEDSSARLEGVKYDETVYAVTVEITDDGKGNLSETVTYSIGEAEKNGIAFTNVYTPVDVEATFSVTKVLENKTKETMGLKGFKFTLSGEGMQDATVETDENGKASFKMTYTADQIGKTFDYTIEEVDTKVEGMVYSRDEVKVSVTVAADENGKLVLTLKQNGATVNDISASFTNVYNGVPENLPTSDYTTRWFWMALAVSVCAGACVIVRKKVRV